MTTPRIISIDPGGRTGVAHWDGHGGVTFDTIPIEGGNIYNDGRYQFRTWVDRILQTYDVVVCEDFTISSRTVKASRQVDALRIIGWLDLECERLGTPFVLQKNTDKMFCSDEKLKQLGWYTGSPGHSDDAARHLFRYLVKEHQADDDVHALLVELTR